MYRSNIYSNSSRHVVEATTKASSTKVGKYFIFQRWFNKFTVCYFFSFRFFFLENSQNFFSFELFSVPVTSSILSLYWTIHLTQLDKISRLSLYPFLRCFFNVRFQTEFRLLADSRLIHKFVRELWEFFFRLGCFVVSSNAISAC